MRDKRELYAAARHMVRSLHDVYSEFLPPAQVALPVCTCLTFQHALTAQGQHCTAIRLQPLTVSSLEEVGQAYHIVHHSVWGFDPLGHTGSALLIFSFQYAWPCKVMGWQAHTALEQSHMFSVVLGVPAGV